MASGNFSDCLAVVLKHEGGYVDHPKDPGGATNLGVTHRTLADHWGRPVTKQDVRGLTQADVEPIYRKGYWFPVQADYLPAGVDLAVFDFGVNSGPSRSAKYLQGVVGAAQDGKVGPKTLIAVQQKDGKDVIQKLCAQRLAFVQGLRHWATFGRGWSRRVADIEARGVSMWMAHETETSPTNQWSVLRGEADAARVVSDRQRNSGVGGAAAGGGGVGLTGDPMLIWIGLGVVALMVLVLVVKSSRNRDRAEAYDRVAGEIV